MQDELQRALSDDSIGDIHIISLTRAQIAGAAKRYPYSRIETSLYNGGVRVSMFRRDAMADYLDSLTGVHWTQQ